MMHEEMDVADSLDDLPTPRQTARNQAAAQRNHFLRQRRKPLAMIVFDTEKESKLYEAEPPSRKATAAWATLPDPGNIPEYVSMDQFFAVDAGVIAHKELTDEVRHADTSSDDECDAQGTSASPPAMTVMNAFDVIRNLFGVHDDDVSMQQITDCEHGATVLVTKGRWQTKLTDFFHK
ncbi:hypothetical protein MRX96_051465 [Rhipicephalus microplus]